MTVKLKSTQYEFTNNYDSEVGVRMVIAQDGEFGWWHSVLSFSGNGYATPQEAVEDLIKEMRILLNTLESGVELE